MQIRFQTSVLMLLMLFLTVNNTCFSQSDSAVVSLNIFPNPNKGTFYITNSNENSLQGQLYAMDRRMMQTLRLESGLNYISLNLLAGIYILIIRKEGAVEAYEEFKIVIK